MRRRSSYRSTLASAMVLGLFATSAVAMVEVPEWSVFLDGEAGEPVSVAVADQGGGSTPAVVTYDNGVGLSTGGSDSKIVVAKPFGTAAVVSVTVDWVLTGHHGFGGAGVAITPITLAPGGVASDDGPSESYNAGVCCEQPGGAFKYTGTHTFTGNEDTQYGFLINAESGGRLTGVMEMTEASLPDIEPFDLYLVPDVAELELGDTTFVTVYDDRPFDAGPRDFDFVELFPSLGLSIVGDVRIADEVPVTGSAGPDNSVFAGYEPVWSGSLPGDVVARFQVEADLYHEGAALFGLGMRVGLGTPQGAGAVVFAGADPYVVDVTVPATVEPGETFTMTVRDGRVSGAPISPVAIDFELPDALDFVAGSTQLNDGMGGTTSVDPSYLEAGIWEFDEPNATTSPGETLFTVDLAVDGMAMGDLEIRVNVDGEAGFGTTTVATGPRPAPTVALFGAVRGPERIAVAGSLQGDPRAVYALGLTGSDDGCASGGTTAPYGTILVETNAAGNARFGAEVTGLSDVRESVRVVDAGKVVPGDGPGEYIEGATYLATNGWPGSGCVFAGFGNDSWPTALPLTPQGGVDDRITIDGSDRWYRVPVTPGSRVTIDLSNLPANYDLTAFTDIEEAFFSSALGDPVAALDRAGAQSAPSAFSPSAFSPSAFSPSAFSPSAFSPSAFSPSAFSPSAFSPSAFSPSAFSPSAFSPSAFSPSAFSPSAFSPSAFSPSAFSPSAFSPSAFSPSAFSPSAFSPTSFAPSAFSPSAFSPEDYAPSAFSPSAFSAAQSQSVIAVAATPGPVDEQLVLNTWDNDTSFYVRVSGAGGVSDPDASYTVSITTEGTSCEGVSRLGAAPADVPGDGTETIILWDSTRTDGTSAEFLALSQRLDLLADDTNGVIVDVADPSLTRLADLRAQADANVDCVYATNLYAQGIKDVVDSYRANNPMRYVVLVGNDGAIPFFRYPDQGLLGPESDYSPPVSDQTSSQAALRENQVLGQDEYGASVVLNLNGTRQPIPDLAVGRLVENAAEITGMIDVHLGLEGAVLEPRSTLVTGYDFLTDAAEAVQTQLVAGTSDGVTPPTNDALVVDGDVAPSDPLSWTATDLREAFLRPQVPHDLVFLAGHFSANSALAADYETSILTTELETENVDLEGSIVFSGGCHSGYNIVDGHAVPGLTLQLDWAQALAQRGATLVAGTGYQYGDTELIEYSERLYVSFAEELRRGTGAQSVGEALVRAKLDYLQTTPDARGLHRKSLLIATVFGLPMTSVDMPGERLPFATPADITPVLFNDGDDAVFGPAEQLGLEVAPLSLNIELGAPTAVQLDVYDDAGNTGDVVGASYYVGADGNAVQPNEPILPLVTTDVTVPGRSLRGVAFRGGSYTDERAVPLSGAATTELRGVHVPFASEVFFPMKIATPNYVGAVGNDGRTRLHVTPVQHRVDEIGDFEATRRVFESIDMSLFYSDVVSVDASTPGLSAAPRIVDVRTVAVDDGDGLADLEFFVRVMGDPSAGMQEVWVTYTESVGGSAWTSLDLAPVPGSNGLWSGVLADAADIDAPQLDFMVQALNGVGRVALDDAFGGYYRAGGTGVVPPVVAPPTATALVLDVVPGATPFGGTATVGATLTSDGIAVENARVLLGLGTSVRSVVTDATGAASATFRVTSAPGTVPVTASFVGTDTLARSSARTSMTVVRTASVVTITADGAGGVLIALTTPAGAPLGEQSLVVQTDTGQLAVITAPNGTVRVGPAAIGASTSVTVSYAGSNRSEAATSTLVLESELTPDEVLRAVAAELAAAAPGLDDKDRKRVEKAVDRLTDAADDYEWDNGRPLEHKVLHEIEKAVKELEKLKSSDGTALVAEYIETLWQTARAITVDAIDAAVGVSQEDLDKANDELARGDDELADGDVSKAIGRWEKALKKVLED